MRQSVLTGNIRPMAEAKLAALGLDDQLDLRIGAYGDDHEVRAELVGVARRRAAAAHGRSPADFAGRATVLVGDTPLDIEAALASGARAVGVATGPFPAADLRAAGAHAVLPDLADTALVVRAILSLCLAGVASQARAGRLAVGWIVRRAACGRTGLELTGPAACPQRVRHLRRCHTPIARDVVPAVPERRPAVGRRGVVAAPVYPAPFSGMGLLSV